MKKILLTIAAASLIAVPGTFAQAQKHYEHTQARAGQLGTRVDHHLSYLTTVLSLSNSQRQQVKTILMNAVDNNRSIIANLKTERDDLRAAVEKNEPSNAMQQISDKLGNDVSKLAMNEANAGEQLYKVLNSEQQTKLTQLQNENFGFGMGWGARGI